MRARRFVLVGLVGLCVMVVSLVLGAGFAVALPQHVFLDSFGSSGSGAGQLSSPSDVAVDDTTGSAAGDIYVADTGNDRIDQFDASGNFVRAWGWGVADGVSAELQTCTLICFKGLSGSGPGQFQTPVLVAVDNSSGPSEGDVYVGDIGTALVTKFNASGELVSGWGVNGQLETPGAQPANGIAVDSTGDLLDEWGAGYVAKYAQDGSLIKEFYGGYGGFAGTGLSVNSNGNIFAVDGLYQVVETNSMGIDIHGVATGATGIAVDPYDNDLYVDHEGSEVAAYDETPNNGSANFDSSFVSFGSGDVVGGAGLAVNSIGGVDVADRAGDRIDVFTLVGPFAATSAATGVTGTSGVLNGRVAPTGGGDITECVFEYVDQVDYKPNTANPYGAGHSVPCSPNAPYAGPGNVSAVVTGLNAGTTYHFRIVAKDANGTDSTGDSTFMTQGPSVVEESATNVASTSATLQGEIDPNGTATTYRFEYLADEAYEANLNEDKQGFAGAVVEPVSGASIGSATEVETVVSQHLQELLPNTPYRYRLTAINALGSDTGVAETFTTQSASVSLQLPDGRQWEMVSPPEKHGAALQPIGEEGVSEASASGDAITYIGSSPTEADPQGNTIYSQVLAERGADGWSSVDIGTRSEHPTSISEGAGYEYRAFTPELTQAMIEPEGPDVTPLAARCDTAHGISACYRWMRSLDRMLYASRHECEYSAGHEYRRRVALEGRCQVRGRFTRPYSPRC